jgi:hypothetical protein
MVTVMVMVIAGAPSYLNRFGEPKTIADLDHHNRRGSTISGRSMVDR